MMHDRWPPEPPRYQPRNERRAGNALLVALLALIVVTVLIGVAGWVMTYTPQSLG
jgi:Tfp pilus assembly protein PilX